MPCANADTPATQLSQEAAEEAVLCLINEQRAANGVQALTPNQKLRAAARLQAEDAKRIKWWAGGGPNIHTNPETQSTPQSRIRDAGYCPGEVAPLPPTSENGYDTWYNGGVQYQGGTAPRAAVTWWMNSPPHKATLLNPKYRESGVAVVLGVAERGDGPDHADGGAIFVQTFGGCAVPEAPNVEHFPGWWRLDNNRATVAIVVGGNSAIQPMGDHLYQLHNTGHIFKYTGQPATPWQLLDQNPATKQIAGAWGNLYQIHNTGRIWKYTGPPATPWQLLDQNPASVAIVAGGSNLYQLHNTGRIWKYTGPPLSGWQLLDQNPASVAIVADGSNLYQLHNTGRILKYTGPPLSGWQLLDENPATKQIAGAWGNLYQIHNNGNIFSYTGPPVTGWRQIDGNPASVSIVAGGNNLYQLHNDGSIWRYTK